ncbi:MAG: FtsX-like permease family protein [Sulfolobales archaeon]
MFLRKSGSALAIMALALLVAVAVSMTSVANYVGSQPGVLAGSVRVGGSYLILGRGADGLIDSRVDSGLVGLFSGVKGVSYVFPQRVFESSLHTGSGDLGVRVRAVDRLGDYLRHYGASVRGSPAKGVYEACVGEVLARIAGVDVNSTLRLSLDGRDTSFTVSCVYRSRSALDSEILVPLTMARGSELSIIEFVIDRGASEAEVLGYLGKTLPSSVRIVKVQQLDVFLSDMNSQTMGLLGFWSSMVYASVFVASYVITTRLVLESSYELSVLRALGAGRRYILASLLVYIVIVAIAGSALGIAIGVVGAQVISTTLRWAQLGIELAPFLKPEQAAWISMLTILSSILGSLYPALRFIHERYRDLFYEV